MGLEPGTLVSKHVKLVRMLKRGGMGSVWVADHLALNTQVAVKFMSGAASEEQEMVARFAREATLAAQIKSPHVVQIHDHGVTPQGEPFIVMELLEGEDLSARMKREGTMSLDDVATILVQSSRVLGKAHQMGIVHRDIKPSNIFLVDNQGDLFIKVLDFGVAKMSREGSELTGTGAMVGTVVYMSPEQLLSARKVDNRADLWSLAVVAYRAITGQLPFKDDDGLGALCKALEHGIFFPPSAFVPDLPPEVDDWFERAFKRDPEARFPTAREFADEFCVAIGKAAAPASVRADALPAAITAGIDGAQVADARTAATISSPSARSHVAPPEKPRPPAEPDDFGTLGASPSQTVAAAAPPPRSGARRALVVVASLGAVGVLGLAGAAYLGKLGNFRLGHQRAPAAPIAVDPGVIPTAPSAATAPSAPTIAAVAPVTTGSPGGAPATTGASSTAVAPATTGAPSASTSAAPRASASSAAPQPSSSAKAGKGGPRKPEKDYGF